MEHSAADHRDTESNDMTTETTRDESSDEAGLLQYHEPESWRFYRYGKDENGDPLFSFYMNLADSTGVCIYDRNGGVGKWHSTVHDEEEYAGEAPTQELKDCVEAMVGDGPGVDMERVQALPDHEQYFIRTIQGTIKQKGRAAPELLRFIGHCAGTEVRLEP